MGKNVLLLGVMLSVLLAAGAAQAREKYIIQHSRSDIRGSVRYTILGKYQARFEGFSGEILFEEQIGIIQSVSLRIQVKSIKSDFPILDKIVRSKQILDAEKYPEIIFKSSDIKREGDRFSVRGYLTVHGVTKEMSFIFDAQSHDNSPVGYLTASGSWIFNRKDFRVIWNKILDKGGILIGNDITVDWNVTAAPATAIR